MKIAGLFAGIGGIEAGFHRALGEHAETVMLCENWAPAKRVLSLRFPGVDLRHDVRDLGGLPAGVDLLAAGFPCTDLSQAGRTAGISGQQSSLVRHVFEALRLAAASGGRLPWLLIENVPNMLTLDRGRAMAYLVQELEALGYRWAYRVVDTRFTGLPQRRRRVILLASARHDPRSVLFRDDAGERPETDFKDDAFGFYWTEGRGGLGWARDAVPTLKGGSTIGIASPPAIWVPGAPQGRRFVVPSVEDAEALQGFARGWTDVAGEATKRGVRWKLVGNAVTTRVARWAAECIDRPKESDAEESTWTRASWPTAAWGDGRRIRRVHVSEFPRHEPYEHLSEVVDLNGAAPLSHRAINGFRRRLLQGNLGRHQGFREDVEEVADGGNATLSIA